MANDYTKNPYVLDTAGGGIERETITARVMSIEWVKPKTVDHLATVTDNKGNTIAEFRCVTPNLNMIKYFNPPKNAYGFNVTALSSGKLLVTVA